MNEPTQCPECGLLIPADSPRGFCPRCMLGLGGASPDTGAETVEGAGDGSGPPVPMTPEELGKLLPDFEVIELLGSGGMGAVYKARQPRLDRYVAIKVLTGLHGSSDMFRKRFQREARAMAALNHPHIVTIHDSGVANDLYYIVMEYVDGLSLRDLIQAGGIRPHEALAMVPQICDALQYAHDQGFVHRDIKPGNILLNRKGWVKIADFGIAKLLGADAAPVEAPETDLPPPSGRDLTQAGQLMGTPQYMAPEQREHPLSVDHRADIYSLGVVFYEMLTGELPKKNLEPPSLMVQVDVRIDEVVLRAMEKEPVRRYQQASEIKSRIEEVSGEAAGPPRTVAGAFFRRNPLLSGLAAAGLAGLLLAGWREFAREKEDTPAASVHYADLFSAALRADAKTVRKLIGQGADVQQRDADGNTPLLVAARSGSWECFQLLEKAGADLKAVNRREEGALHLASSGGRVETEPPVPSNAPDEAYQKIMTRLLEKGAKVNAWTSDARMPVHFAAFGGRPALVKLLLDKGAFPIMPDTKGSAPFLEAARVGATEVLALLMERGVSAGTRGGGVTALHWAAARNDLPSADLLLGHAADPGVQDNKSETPLHWAAQKGHVEVALRLIGKGALLDSRNNQYQTPLHQAVQAGHFSVVKALCEHGANLNARSLDARSPLDLARESGRNEIIRYLENLSSRPKESPLP